MRLESCAVVVQSTLETVVFLVCGKSGLGHQPSKPPQAQPIQSLNYEENRERFNQWLLNRHSLRHAKTMMAYASRYLPPTIGDQFRLKEAYDGVKSGKRSLSLAIRNLLNYFEEFSLIGEDDLHRYRKVVKVPKTGTDDCVPETAEVIRAFGRFPNDDYRLFFGLMLYSGLRVVEGVELLRVFDESRLMSDGKIAKYPLSMNRQTKRALFAYMPASFASTLHHAELTSNAIKMYFSRHGLPAKYLRKWQYNFMIENDVPESVCDFIQGRSLGKSVGGMHYLAKVKQSDMFYSRVVGRFPAL